MSETTIHALIDAQQERLTHLLQLLQQETEALLERDADKIESLLKQKLTLLDQIGGGDKALEAHPHAAQIKSDNEAMAGVARCRDLLAECQLKNQHNSQLADQSLASLGRLQQLLNTTRNPNALTYNQEGTTTTGGRLGKVIKA
ncbi:flagellar export chaperone FlgN [Ferrimonas futtsuensis]|uniref:flagellar export chaperone FlgN n=1 Tax=Ferrimonas futtsuensis TaxID=364764 RepID=UPI0003FA27D8|nr:flagellar export chaperone FlgN [Ferrimonas futtsuensis]